MHIVLTGSLGNIGKPLTRHLVENNHSVTVISSKPERQEAIRALGARPAIGSMFDTDFLTRTFRNADIVYLMETMESAGDIFDPSVDLIGTISRIGAHYKQAVETSGVKRVVHLSSVGAHMDQGNGILRFHYNVEQTLRQLPGEIAIKFIRPVGFYLNMFSFISTIKNKGAIISNYGGDQKEPWVSPLDIAEVIACEMEHPFSGRTVRYVASDEVSPNEIARVLGAAIGKPDLPWKVISNEQLLYDWLAAGFNPQVAKGFVELQVSQGNGLLYEDYYRHKPVPGKVKLADFAGDFASAFKAE